MKIQSLAVIFIIIILPISMVLSEYISNLIETKEVETQYDTKLLNSTYDAIKAYQLNTVNNAFGDVTTQTVDDVEAATETFFNSLTSSFNYSGYDSHVMQEYVPAVVFTMYDGYYIYSPYTNVLTELKKEDDYDNTFSENGKIKNGLKPYVYYNCRYQYGDKDKNDFVISYTLDNYITIQGLINGYYVYDCGYIYAIAKNKGEEGIYYDEGEKTYTYNGVEFSESDTEELKEYVGTTEYSYVKINGKKYYLDEEAFPNRGGGTISININEISEPLSIPASAGIFYIDKDGKKNYNQTKGYSESNQPDENREFIKYYLAIKYNKSAYEYFKRAYEFSTVVFGEGAEHLKELYEDEDYEYKDMAGIPRDSYGLSGLSTKDAITNDNVSDDITNIKEYGDFEIFGENGKNEKNNEKNIGKANSNFEQHRKAVIRYVIETNLTTSIKGFSSTANADAEFMMPKISEKDWELIENDICAISFMQGLPIASKKYNGYAVVANTLTNEYIDEQDIYILVKDKLDGNNKFYCKPTDNELIKNDGIYVMIEKGNPNIDPDKKTFYPGIWKLNFELKQDASNAEETIIYQPMSYAPNEPYLGSYTSVMGTSSLNFVGTQDCPDMYTYMNDKNDLLKKAYYVGLARERWGTYNVNNINYELHGFSNNCEFYLESYEFTYEE